MSTLPSLNTDAAGQTAFYNLIEQGGMPEVSMTWSEVLDNGSVNSYSVYDNGVILKYDDNVFGELTIRCKTDGWVVAYTPWDGSEPGDYSFGGAPALLTVDYSGNSHSISTADNNRLVQAIQDISSDLSDWNLVSFNPSDVGLYDFTFGADAVSFFDGFEPISDGSGSDNSTATNTADLTASEAGDTTLHSAQIFANAYVNSADYGTWEAEARVEAANEILTRDSYEKGLSGYPDTKTADVTTAVRNDSGIDVLLWVEQGFYPNYSHALLALHWSDV